MAIPSPEPNGGSGQYTGLDQWGRPVTVTNYAPGVQDRTAWYNVWRYYQPGNDGPDHGPMFRRAIAQAKAAGGGDVYAPTGVYTCGGAVDAFGNLCAISLPSGVTLRGDGIGATIIQLANGQNCDLIQGENAPALINIGAAGGTGDPGGISNWRICDLTLDGNRGGQSGGTSYGIRAYGLDYVIRDVVIRSCFTGGMLLDWNGGNTPPGQDGMEARLEGVKLRNNNGIGLTWGGPHDSQMANILIENSGSHGLYVGPHAFGLLATNLHSWGSGLGVSAVAGLIEGSGCQFSNSVFEGSDTVQLVILANGVNFTGGNIYGANGQPSSAIQLGQQAGQTPYPSSVLQSGGLTTAVAVKFCIIQTQLSNVVGANGAIWFANDGGNNQIEATLTQGSGSMFTGTMNNTTQALWSTSGLSGGGNLPILQLAGALVLGRSSEQVPATGGQITTQGFSMIRCNPAGNITGVILQQGSFYQFIVIRNQSAFSISFAAAATSHVADEAGGTNPIPANTARAFAYDVGTGKWYRCA